MDLDRYTTLMRIYTHIAYTLDDYVYICITTNRLLYNQTCTDRRCRFAIVLFVFFSDTLLKSGTDLV